MVDIVEELEKAAGAIYVAVAEPVAKDVSQKILKAADEIERLREFVRWAVVDVSFQGCNADGCEIQEKAEELGLIESRPVEPEDAEAGVDELYYLTFPVPSEGSDTKEKD